MFRRMKPRNNHLNTPLFRKRQRPEKGNCQVCPLYKGPLYIGPHVQIPEEEGVCVRVGGLCERKKNGISSHD